MVTGIILCCLTALMPALLLFFPNMGEILLGDMLPYFGIMLGIGILAWAFMYLVFRRKGMAAVTAAVWLLVLLNVGRLVPAIQKINPLIGIKVIGPVVLVFLAAVTFGLSRLKEDFLNDAARVLCLALAAFLLTTAVPQFFRAPEAGEEDDEFVSAEEFDLTPAEGTDRPNIYWVISDEYAGLDELDRYFHYDNTPFYNELRDMGFTVSDKSYNWSRDTYTILRGILGLKYSASPEAETTPEKEQALADGDLALMKLMDNLGYKVYEAESTNKFRFHNRLNKEIVDNSPRTVDGKAVANLLLEYSILYRYENAILRRLAPGLAPDTEREAVLNVFEWAENPESMRDPGPNFTVIYVKCPHFPFIFDRNGKEVPESRRMELRNKKYYLDQLVFVTGHLRKICQNIIAEDPDSIIVLQSDHGYRFVSNITWLDMTNIMNAVYFRGQPMESIEGKNGLNTWIAVVRKQFGVQIPEVKEKRLKYEYRPSYRDKNAEDPNEGLIPEE